jgi:predicted nucleic acid-binding protein
LIEERVILDYYEISKKKFLSSYVHMNSDKMKKLRVYIDTSVIGAMFDKEDQNRILSTQKLLELLKERKKYHPFISNVLLEEIDQAPLLLKKGLKKVLDDMAFDIILENNESVELVKVYMDEKILNEKYRDDLRHVALSVVNNIDFIVSWNCKHLSNIEKKRRFNSVNLKMGYRDIDIITPMEVSKDD